MAYHSEAMLGPVLLLLCHSMPDRVNNYLNDLEERQAHAGKLEQRWRVLREPLVEAVAADDWPEPELTKELTKVLIEKADQFFEDFEQRWLDFAPLGLGPLDLQHTFASLAAQKLADELGVPFTPDSPWSTTTSG